jgi:3-hydroxybutyryl-CoA dehydratase
MSTQRGARALIPIPDHLKETVLRLGHRVTYAKTVSESDVYGFAGITGDLSPNHVNEQYMAATRYGHRIAHGALLVGYMSTCSTKLIEEMGNVPTVSYGYDRIRFIRPVFIGDTVTLVYEIAERNDEEGRILSNISVENQRGELVALAVHILRLV